MNDRDSPALPVEALRVLLVEDTDDDAALIARALGAAGFKPTIQRVQTEDEFRAALSASSWDLVISDHSLPRFSSTVALWCLHAAQVDVPFIVVSGTIDEESAVSILKAGAHDFVTKQNLARLGPAIRRELQDATHRAERRAARRDLEIQRDVLRLVIDTNPGLIFVKDRAGRFTLANRAVAELYGKTVDELAGADARELKLHAADAGLKLEAEEDVLATGRPRFDSAEAITDARTGKVRWFEMRRVPLVLPDGSSGVLGIGTEVTDRRLAETALRATEEQFRQAQKMEAIGQLAGGIAHDFNNLLTAILGYSELLLDRVRDQPDVVQDIEEIRNAGERARSLTAQLLTFSRKQVLEPQILDLNQVVTDAERILRRVIGEDIELVTVKTKSPQRFKADPGQMHQVLMNLAVNARDAMPRGGKLRIETGSAEATPPLAQPDTAAGAKAYVTLKVSDTGCGMPPEVQSRIFEPFFTTKAAGKGTGLGLSMVFGVVTQSGGHITVDTERDRGTTFTIYLPATQDALPARPARSRESSELRGNETILVVEDERGIRDLVRKVLTRYGYQVLEAGDPVDALEMAARHSARIHLLLSDIVMPKMSGPELAQRLVPLRPDMRVLYMSGFVNRLGTVFGSLSSGVDLLHKPFTPEGLVQKVRGCLDGCTPGSDAH
jgi:hypothetical protein